MLVFHLIISLFITVAVALICLIKPVCNIMIHIVHLLRRPITIDSLITITIVIIIIVIIIVTILTAATGFPAHPRLQKGPLWSRTFMRRMHTLVQHNCNCTPFTSMTCALNCQRMR